MREAEKGLFQTGFGGKSKKSSYYLIFMDKVKLYKDFREKKFFDLSSPLRF